MIHKQVISMSRILKLREVGLLNVLKDRWLGQEIKQNYDDKTLQPIEIYQVSVVIAVCCAAGS